MQINDADSQLRSRTSEIRVLTSDSSLMEARNDELRNIISEEDERLQHLSRVEKSHQEALEYDELNNTLDNSMLTGSIADFNQGDHASLLDTTYKEDHKGDGSLDDTYNTATHTANVGDESLEGSVYHTHRQVEELTTRLNSMGDIFQ